MVKEGKGQSGGESSYSRGATEFTQRRFLPTFQVALTDCVTSSICKNLLKSCQYTHPKEKNKILAEKELVMFLIAGNLEEWGLEYRT